MKELKFPYIRAQFIVFIRGLSDYNYQMENWQIIKNDKGRCDELDYTIHFLYDDTDISKSPSSAIGDFLYDEAEAKAMRAIISSLDVVFDKYGLELKDAGYLQKPEWKEVVGAALEALPMFVENGIGSFK